MKPNTPFKLMMRQLLHAESINVLTLLYQPIIGSEALSVYLTLCALHESDETLTHHRIIQITNQSIDSFLIARQKLEAVHLLQSFEDKNSESMTYVILAPLNKTRFFNDGTINVFLSLHLGLADYKFIRALILKETDEISGMNVSKAFNEVFDTSIIQRQIPSLEALAPVTQEKEGVFLEAVFDVKLLMTLLKQFGIDDKNLSQTVIEQLNKVAFLYKLDEHELARLVFDSVDTHGFVNLETFRRLAKQHFNLLNKGRVVKPSLKDEQIPMTESKSTQQEAVKKDSQLFEYLSERNPIDFLRDKSHQKEPVPADRQLVEWLVIDQQMPSGVVNVLIDYVLRVSNGRLPKVFVEKVAGEWQRKNITSTDKAMHFVKEQLKPKPNPSVVKPKSTYAKSKPIRQEQLPDWFANTNQLSESQSTSTQTKEALVKIEQMKRLQEELLFKKGGQSEKH